MNARKLAHAAYNRWWANADAGERQSPYEAFVAGHAIGASNPVAEAVARQKDAAASLLWEIASCGVEHVAPGRYALVQIPIDLWGNLQADYGDTPDVGAPEAQPEACDLCGEPWGSATCCGGTEAQPEQGSEER